jgi:hypothetical protein
VLSPQPAARSAVLALLVFREEALMAEEYVFRFVSMRPLNPKKKTERETAKTELYPEVVGETDFHESVKRAVEEGVPRERISGLARAYARSDRYVRRLEDLPFDVKPGLAWVEAHIADKPTDAVWDDLEQRYGKSVDQLVEGGQAGDALARLADTILAEALAPGPARNLLDDLTGAHKFLGLLLTRAERPEAIADLTLGELVADRVVLVTSKTRPPRLRSEPPRESEPRGDDQEKEAERVRGRLRDLERAHRELADLAVQPSTVVQPERRVEGERLRALESRINELASLERPDEGRRPRLLAGETIGELPGTGPVILAREAVDKLSEDARNALRSLKIDLSQIDPVGASARIEREMETLGGRLASAQQPTSYLMLGGVKLNTQVLKKSLGFKHGHRPAAGPMPHECEFAAGVGDLLLVRQTLKAYELAEFAHVENVLAGETREREHRRLNLREEIEVREEERETEKERDLQSTERNEMQSEAEKTVKTEFGLEAGLQVSGSYGPTVSFSASLNASFSTSSEESQRKAVSYSREVTDRTSERVRERVKQELRRRLLEETQEINKHGITNVPPNGHIRGIYRWLNKIYDAQIFNYGQRMMYEFVVPEPAAYFLYALIENPPSDLEIEKPDPPTYYGAPLKPSHLTRTNYQDFVAKYQVRNVPAAPPEFQHAAYFDKQDKVQDGSIFGRSGKLEVPAGYAAYAASVMSDYSFTSGQEHHFRVMLGNRNFDRSNYWGAEYQNLGERYREMSVAYHLMNAWSFTLGIDVYCRLTAEGLSKWQQQVYDAIVEAYVRQLSQYEEKLAAVAIQKGVEILGRNPLENRRLEREELKKLVLMLLTDSTDTALDSYLGGAEPLMDLDAACENGNRIRFFENAFEWTNMLYVLYPYFWGRKARWITALHLTDPDLDFAAFLKAGAARVQVPVRPGFERAVAHFCQFGEIWEGNDAPLRDDDLYVPIVDEIAANLGKLDDGVPYPEGSQPWEVRIPTSLVLVQNLDEVPGIRDVLTGNPVSIEN